MSTLSKLNPTVRRNRADRRDAIRALHRVIPKVPSLIGRVTAMATAAGLEDIRRAPFLTGAEKQELFDRTIDRLKEAK